MSNEIQGIRTVYNLEALAESHPIGYKRAFEQLADQEEATFWESYYYELFEEFVNSAGQPMLTAPNNQYGNHIRMQGTVRVPQEIREQWRREYDADTEQAEVMWLKPESLTIAFNRSEGVNRIPEEGGKYLADYIVRLIQEFMGVAMNEAAKMRAPESVHESAEELEPLFDASGEFVIYKSELVLHPLSTQLDTKTPEMC